MKIVKKHWNYKVFQQRRIENEKVENESRISGGRFSEPTNRVAVLHIISTLRLKALRVTLTANSLCNRITLRAKGSANHITLEQVRLYEPNHTHETTKDN